MKPLLPEIGNLTIVLIEPQIPQNTGNITRLCACIGADLYLVGTLGFRLSDKFLDRAAMDYRQMVEPKHVATFEEVLTERPAFTPYFLTSKAAQAHWDITYPNKTMLVFGSETTGLPERFIAANLDKALRIPMQSEARSLNLGNSVAIVSYEVLRQNFSSNC